MNHFTDQTGFNGIRSQMIWRFIANQPPGNHPFGAYFTTLPRGTPNLAAKLGIPKAKLLYVFEFQDMGDLKPLPGGRGQYVLFSPQDYYVDQLRQVYSGAA